jgi:biofilm PGA synthesis N-glycosyltransferase PgaC
LTVTYLIQASVSLSLDRRVERGIMRVIVWQAWYPLFFWVLQALTAIVGVPRAILRLTRTSTGTWVSPDRGVR